MEWFKINDRKMRDLGMNPEERLRFREAQAKVRPEYFILNDMRHLEFCKMKANDKIRLIKNIVEHRTADIPEAAELAIEIRDIVDKYI